VPIPCLEAQSPRPSIGERTGFFGKPPGKPIKPPNPNPFPFPPSPFGEFKNRPPIKRI